MTAITLMRLHYSDLIFGRMEQHHDRLRSALRDRGHRVIAVLGGLHVSRCQLAASAAFRLSRECHLGDHVAVQIAESLKQLENFSVSKGLGNLAPATFHVCPHMCTASVAERIDTSVAEMQLGDRSPLDGDRRRPIRFRRVGQQFLGGTARPDK